MSTAVLTTPAVDEIRAPPVDDSEPPQYSRRKVLGIWAAAAVPMGILAWLVAPWLSDRIGGRDPFIEALLICFSIGLVWELALRGGAARRRSRRRARPIGLQRRDRCALPARHGFRRTPTGPLATVSHV